MYTYKLRLYIIYIMYYNTYSRNIYNIIYNILTYNLIYKGLPKPLHSSQAFYPQNDIL